jgi:hypothetical protein
MKPLSGRSIIIIGFLLVLLGFIIPFLMVMKIIESGFFLSFVSFASSTIGMFLGLIGAAMYVRDHRR